MIPSLIVAIVLGITGLMNIGLGIREKNYAIGMIGVLFMLLGAVWVNFAILYGVTP